MENAGVKIKENLYDYRVLIYLIATMQVCNDFILRWIFY